MNRLLAILGAALILSCPRPAVAEYHPAMPKLNDAGATQARAGKFECGTYKGSERWTQYFGSKNERVQRELDQSGTRASKRADFVYQDVLVVEDDGSILFSGLNAFDTDNTTIRFTPNGNAYDVSAVTFTYDAVLGTNLSLGDDAFTVQSLSFNFTFFGGLWTQMYVGSNGIVGFGGNPNPSGFYDDGDFFSSLPKITPYYMDLNPAAGGAVYHKQEATRSTVTWSSVPEFGTATLNTVQMVVYDTGVIDITFNGIGSAVASNGAPIFSGISPGTGLLNNVSYSDDLPFAGTANTGIYEDYLNIATPLVNEAGLFQHFYASYPDDFFQIVYFTNFVTQMTGFAYERNISNDVTGIGLGIFDNSATYGSAGTLESLCNMNRLSVWPTSPETRFFSDGNSFLTVMAQEAGHRWGAFMRFGAGCVQSGENVSAYMIGRQYAHWSYFADADNSSLEGGNWEFNGANWTNPTQVDHFCDIDEYTFGLRTPEEVSDAFYLDSPTNNQFSNRDDGTPVQNATASGTPVVVTINDFIACEGARTPTEPNENHDVRQAFILIVQNGTTPSQAELDKIAGFRAAWEPYFEESCSGRLTANTSITQTFDPAVVKGQVTDQVTGLVIDDFTATSIERNFVQNVPGGGRYTFRYLEAPTSGPFEVATVVFQAAGYFPDTCFVSVPYDSVLCKDVTLFPVSAAAAEGAPIPNALYQNYPNPFNPNTTIQFDLADAGRVELQVFDARGKLVATLVSGEQSAGRQLVDWDGTDNRGRQVSSGIYFYKLSTNDFTRTRKMVLLK